MTLIIVVILVALAFEFINGFHDTANSIATVVSTKVLTPRQAILLAAATNLLGALIGHAVAKTISSGLVDSQFVSSATIICALIGGIAWNLLTWWLGLPSSSSHALVGGLCGATLASSHNRISSVFWTEGILPKVIWPMLGSPVIGLLGGFAIMTLLYALLRNARPMWVNRFFGRAQVFSAGYMGLAHGLADAQKTMGIITLALVTATGAGTFHHLPDWLHFLKMGKPPRAEELIKSIGSAAPDADLATRFDAEIPQLPAGTFREAFTALAAEIHEEAGDASAAEAFRAEVRRNYASDLATENARWGPKIPLIGSAMAEAPKDWVQTLKKDGDKATAQNKPRLKAMAASVGNITPDVPAWIKVICALTMAAGTSAGGWRIIKTMGHRMVKLQPVHGFAAETTAATILAVTGKYGMTVSTTHCITTAIMGVGATKRFSAIDGQIVRRILGAWVLTLPAAAGAGYAAMWIWMKLA